MCFIKKKFWKKLKIPLVRFFAQHSRYFKFQQLKLSFENNSSQNENSPEGNGVETNEIDVPNQEPYQSQDHSNVSNAPPPEAPPSRPASSNSIDQNNQNEESQNNGSIRALSAGQESLNSELSSGDSPNNESNQGEEQIRVSGIIFLKFA